jgi:outer membrane immunogenic protein
MLAAADRQRNPFTVAGISQWGCTAPDRLAHRIRFKGTIVKSILIFSAALTSLVGAPVAAADLAVRPAPLYKAPPPAAVFSWTGCYGGVNAGYAWGRADVVTTLSVPGAIANAIAAADSPSVNLPAFTGGVQVGCNYQAGAIVWGLEGDLEYFGLRGSASINAFTPAGREFSTANSVSSSWLATLRPRAGVAVGRALIYVTGGLAATNLRYDTTFMSRADLEVASIDTTKMGWAIGGGWEYAFDLNWSAKLEYLYTDFGHASTAAPETTAGVPVFTMSHDVRLRSSLVRAGLNYHFGGPVMAKY